MISLSEQKTRLRDVAHKRRDTVAMGNDIGDRLRDNFAAIGIPAGATTVSGYWPIGAEANVMPLLLDLGRQGMDMALPVVTGRGNPLTFRQWRTTYTMSVGPFGIREPKSDARAVIPDLLLVPLLAFDLTGQRLGYGGGFYDRTMTGMRSRQDILAVGVAYAAQECEAVPCGETDAVLDWIVTETEAIRVVKSTSHRQEPK